MNFFSSKKNYIGVDIGTSAVKMVELQDKSGHALLLTYGYAEQSTDIVRASSEEMENKIVKIIKSVHQASRMTSQKVIAALPSFSVFSSIINLPVMNKKELDQAIRWEAKKFVPLPIEEMTLDWKIIEAKKHAPAKKLKEQDKVSQAEFEAEKSKEEKKEAGNREGEKNSPAKSKKFDLTKIFSKKENERKNKLNVEESKSKGKNMNILLTAAPKNLVEKYVRVFKSAGLDLLSLETESFALERSLVGGSTAPVMVIDIGAVSSDISIIKHGIPILNRSVDVGGVTITKAVMSSLNVDLARAEQFKRDIGFSAAGHSELPDVIKNAINPIVNEAKYSLDIYLSQSQDSNQLALEKIILTGGSAFLPELPNYLSRILDMKVIIGDPWDRVIYPLELKPALAELGPRFSVAVGLAMREI